MRKILLLLLSTVIFAQIEVSPSTLDFGNVVIGDSLTLSFTVTTSLEQTITISEPGNFFELSNNSIEAIDGGEYQIDVRCLPLMAGDLNTSIDLTGDTFGDATISLSALAINDPLGIFGSGIDGDLSISGTQYVDNVKTVVSSLSDTGSNIVYVGNPSGFSINDEILIISLQDPTTGNVEYNATGQYETKFIESIDGNTFTLSEPLINSYDPSNDRKHQVQKIPHYNNVSVNGTWTTEDWNGESGGVFFVRILGTLEINYPNGRIRMDGKGYRGGAGAGSLEGSGIDGEGIGGYGDESINGGIGGNAGGIGYGASYTNSDIYNRMTLGGGGGGSGATWCNGYCSNSGGDGGGIIFIYANSIINNHEITSTGYSVCANCSGSTRPGGGSGAGGSIRIESNNFQNISLLEAISDIPCASGSCNPPPGGSGQNGLIYIIVPYTNSQITSNPSSIIQYSGCTDMNACNYSSNVAIDDGSCIFPPEGYCDCNDNIIDCTGECGGEVELDECGICGGDNSYCSGCMDESASNYDSEAIIEDNSCIFGPNIISIYDAPQDQGGYVFINWSPNTLDSDPNEIILSYSIWRYVPSNRGWEFLDEINAYYFEEYTYLAPTIYISSEDTIYTTYKVLAHTENQWEYYESIPDSGYSVDNLAPTIPQQFSAENNGVDQVTLSWEYETEDDFSHHEFNSLWNDTQTVTDSFYVSSFTQEYDEYYLKSIDVNGNISDASPITSVHRFSEGANLVSFNSLPNQAHPSTILGDVSYGMIGEGTAASNIDGTWVGSLTDLNQCDGYWVFTESDVIHSITGSKSNCVHALNEGSNLKGYSCEHPVQIVNAIDDACVSGLIGEGVAVIKIGDNWYGSLQSLYPGDAHWITSECEIPSFQFNCSEPELTRAINNSHPKFPEGMSYAQSSSQGFYFIENIELSDREIEEGDWILAYHNDQLIGARMWKGVYTDIPIMGKDVQANTVNYLSGGDIPALKVLTKDGELYDVNGELEPWSEGCMHVVSSLSTESALPTAYRLASVYPNPFNPQTNIVFDMPESKHVNLTIYDLLGRQVEQLINRDIDAGTHKITWDAEQYPSGIYIVQFNANNINQSQKIVLVK